MAIENFGFGGEINATIWSGITGYIGSQFCVENGDAWRVSAVEAERAVTIAPGWGFAHGIWTQITDPILVNVPAPREGGTGEWTLIVANRTWPTDEAAGFTEFAIADDYETRPANAPGVPPTSVGAIGFLRVDYGVFTQQPIAWVFAVPGSNALIVQDLRVVRNQGYITSPLPTFQPNWRRTLGEEAETYVKRQGDEVIVHMNLQSQTAAIGNRRGETVLVLPQSYRPRASIEHIGLMVDGGNEGIVGVAVLSTGELKILWTSNATAKRMRLDFSYHLTS